MTIEQMWQRFEHLMLKDVSEADRLRFRLAFLCGATGVVQQLPMAVGSMSVFIKLREESQRLQAEILGLMHGGYGGMGLEGKGSEG